MVHIAVYGKGGIGKSTTSSNISYALSARGYAVTQIGCDPKHDSTITLLNGMKQRTVLDYLKNVSLNDRKLEDVCVRGVNGIVCVEAGGPEPGIGCAGRGILTTFDTLGLLGIDDIPTDFTVYDVLGDVVCGGFAVPMRKENTDAVFLVTSGEFMAMYAANNILRGLLNFDPSTPRVAGIILNCRGMKDEYGRVKKLADAVGLPIVAVIPRAQEFADAMHENKTVCEVFPDCEVSAIYNGLADTIVGIRDGTTRLYHSRPLNDEQMEDLARGRPIRPGSYRVKKAADDDVYLPKICASVGASQAGGRIRDLPIIIHGPRSCGHIMHQILEEHAMLSLETGMLNPTITSENLYSTEMEDDASIFGGRDALIRTLSMLRDRGNRAAMVITTCVTGMIGDDIDRTVNSFMTDNPGFKVITVHADGNHTGDYMDGMDAVMVALTDLIDRNLEPTVDGINLADSSYMSFNNGRNEEWTRDLFDIIGMPLKAKLFDDCTVDEIVTCKANRLTIMLSDSIYNEVLRSRLEDAGLNVQVAPLPKGHRQTLEWIRRIHGITGEPKDLQSVLDGITAEYEAAVEKARPELEGKRVDFFVYPRGDIDWMLEPLLDAGVVIGNIHVIRTRRIPGGFTSSFEGLNVIDDNDFNRTVERVNADPPDILLGSTAYADGLNVRTSAPGSGNLTHKAAIAFLDTMIRTVPTCPQEGWKKWRR